MFRAAIDTAREPVLWVDGEGRFAYANRRACDWLGYVSGELGALHIWDVDVGTSRERWPVGWNQPLAEGLIETSFRRRDGAVVPVELSAKDIDVGGRRLRVAFVREITERRATLDALRRTQVAVDKARDPIFWVRPDGSFAYVNDAACKQLEYTREELLQMRVPDINPNIPAATWDERWQKTRRDAALFFERVHRTKGGRDIPVEVSLTFVRFGDEDYNCVYTRDITDRKRAEAEKAKLETQLLHAQKLESVGRLAGGVAHDFNNMLSVILGYTELMAASLPSASPLLSPLDEIKKAACRSRDTTRQLLAFSRKQVIMPRAVNLNGLVEEARNSLLRLIGEDVQLAFVPGEGLWKVMFDPSQAEQMLVNLIVNARDALPRGGRITVETSNVEIDQAYCRDHVDAQPGDYVVLTVSDDGVGMDEETLGHIFEPFFSTKETGKGTGLGLATVYGVIKQNNGFVTVTSSLGSGSTFKLFIPRLKGHVLEAPPATDIAAARGRGTILLVEDDAMVRDLTRSMLEALGYTVLPADSARAALSVCEDAGQRVDLLLSDVVMPDMRGPELRERSTAIRPGLEVLFMSGYAPSLAMGAGGADHPARFIQKPFTMAELARSVQSALQGRAHFTPVA
jgi:PAS domain S-box-containing protein